MISVRACTIEAHDVFVIDIQGMTWRALMVGAHLYFITALVHIFICAREIFAILYACIQLGYVAQGTMIRIAAISLGATPVRFSRFNIAVPFLAKNFMSVGFEQPVVDTLEASTEAFLPAAFVQVLMGTFLALAE